MDTTPASTTRYRTRIALALALVPCLAIAVLVIGSRAVYDRPVLRADSAAQWSSQLWLMLCLLVGLTLAATLVAIGRGHRGLGPGAAALLLVAGLVTPIYAAVALGSPIDGGQAGASLVELSPWGLRCLGIAAAVGVLVLACFTVALRRSVPAASRLRGAALGAAAGAWAGLSIFVFCPAGELRHLLVGHVLPILAFTLLGLAFIPRALRP